MQDARAQRLVNRKWVVGRALPVTVAALVIRLLLLLAVVHAKAPAWFYSQASELGEVAHAVATGQGLASPFGGHTGPSAFLPPGYPLLVGGLFRLFGSYSTGAEVTLLIFQAIFGSVSILLLMLLAVRLFGQTTALITGILLAVDPWLISLGFVFWETSFSLMALSALVLLTVLWIDHPTLARGYAIASLSAMAIAVNASLAVTAVALFAWAVYRSPGSRRLAALPALLFLLLCLVWPIRNEVSLHAFIPLRDNLGYELWQGNHAGADGFFDPELHPNRNRAEFDKFRSMGELGYMQHKSVLAKRAIRSHPFSFFALTAKRIAFFWLGVTRQHYANQILIATLTTTLGLLGLITYARRIGSVSIVPVLLPLLLFPLPYYITHPDFRFWCLLSPMLTAAAVYLFVPSRPEPCQ